MKKIDPKTPIWKLTVEEFLEVSKKHQFRKQVRVWFKRISKDFRVFHFKSFRN